MQRIRAHSPWMPALPAILFLVSVLPALAQAGDQPYLFPRTADPEAMFGPAMNPAALGFSSGLTLGLQTEVPAGQGIRYNPLLIERDWTMLLQLGGSGLAMSSIGSNRYLTLGSGFRVLPGLSLGISTHSPAGDWRRGELRVGSLWRPHAALGVGLVYRADASDSWGLHPGIALRPLALMLPESGHRLAVTADAAFSAAGPSGEYGGLQGVGMQLELLPGLQLYGNYSLEGEWNIGLESAVAYGRSGMRVGFSDGATLQSATSRVAVESVPHAPVPAAPASRIIEYRGLQLVGETTGFQRFGQFILTDGRRPIAELVEEIDRMAGDPAVAGMLFTNPVFDADLSHALEIAAALNRFRQTGRTVVFSFEQIDSVGYLIAAVGGDEMYLRPAGSLLVRGFGSSRLYFADLLDRFGIDAVGFETHPAKSANHGLTESGMTDEDRENLESFLGSAYDTYLQLIAAGRGQRLLADPDELWDQAPYLVAAEAEAAGLIDGVWYHDQVLDALEKRFPDSALVSVDRTRYRDPAWRSREPARIAVLYASGPIMSGEGMRGSTVGSETLVRQIREAREDDRVRAILLRVSSGGGSALASDVIAREVYQTTRGENPKPVVVSMGGVAASGGYYIAAYADHIVAYPLTLTGSIGVTMLSLHIDRLLEDWDISVDGVALSSSSYFADPLRPIEDRDVEKLQEYSDALYQQFLEVVAEGRGMDPETADAAAQGQVWTGVQALELGLIDGLGGILQALEKAVELAGIDGPVELHNPSGGGLLVQGPTADAVRTLLPESRVPELEQLLEQLRQLQQLGEEGGLYLTPYSLRY